MEHVKTKSGDKILKSPGKKSSLDNRTSLQYCEEPADGSISSCLHGGD